MFKHLKIKMEDTTTTQDDPDNAPLPVTDDTQTPDASGTAATTQDPDPDNTDAPQEDPESDDQEIVEIIADSDDIAEESLKLVADLTTLSTGMESFAAHGASAAAADFAKNAWGDILPAAALESLTTDPTGEQMISLARKDLDARLGSYQEKTVALVAKAHSKVSACNGQFADISGTRALSKISESDLATSVENLQTDSANLARLSGGVSTLQSEVQGELKTYSGEAFNSAIDLSVEALADMPSVRARTQLGFGILSTSLENLPFVSSKQTESFVQKAQFLNSIAQTVKQTMRDYAVQATLLH